MRPIEISDVISPRVTGHSGRARGWLWLAAGSVALRSVSTVDQSKLEERWASERKRKRDDAMGGGGCFASYQGRGRD